MKYMAIIDADEKPVSCEFIGCNGNVAPYLIGATTDIKALEKEPKTGHWVKYGSPRCGEQHYKCTLCGYYINFGIWGELYTKEFKHCPNCGGKMIKPQESEDEE